MAHAANDVSVRYGEESDFDWLCSRDTQYVSEDWIRRCLGHKEYIIATDGNAPDRYLGYIRFSMFWGVVPYLDMIRVIEGEQRRGVGSAMFSFWQDEMIKRGSDILMTSSLRDELEPQAWHWRNGFRESGKLTFGSFEPKTEVFFVKELR